MSIIISSICFQHGEETCASEKGKFCRFARPVKNSFGSKYECVLYDDILWDKFGWLQRCDQCKIENN